MSHATTASDAFLTDEENWRFGPDLELRCWPMDPSRLEYVQRAIVEDECASLLAAEGRPSDPDDPPRIAFRMEKMPAVGMRVCLRKPRLSNGRTWGGCVSAGMPPRMCFRACGHEYFCAGNMHDSRVHALARAVWTLAERVHQRVPLRFAEVFEETWGAEGWPVNGGIATHRDLARFAGWPVKFEGEWTAYVASPIGSEIG